MATLEKDIFHTTLYIGTITGNVSYPDVGLGDLVANKITTGMHWLTRHDNRYS
jgi:hypothetical protein